MILIIILILLVFFIWLLHDVSVHHKRRNAYFDLVTARNEAKQEIENASMRRDKEAVLTAWKKWEDLHK